MQFGFRQNKTKKIIHKEITQQEKINYSSSIVKLINLIIFKVGFPAVQSL